MKMRFRLKKDQTPRDSALRINLLPEEYRAQPVINPVRLGFVVLIILLAFAGLSYLGYGYFVLQEERTLLARLEFELALYRGDLAEYETLEQYRKRVSLDQESIERIDQTYPPYRALLDEITGEIPDALWLTTLSWTKEGAINITGQSLGLEELAEFLNRLEQAEYLSSVSLQEISRLKEETDFPLYGFIMGLQGAEGALGNGKQEK